MKLAEASKIVIDDFAGGRNSVDALNQLGNNESPDQLNCYVENRALTQRRGITSVTISVDNIAPNPRQLKETQMAASSLLRLAILGYMATPTARAHLIYTENGTSFTSAGYAVGTCSTAGSSTTVTGAGGTLWDQHAAVGDYFVQSGGTPNKITAVNSDTEIVVTTAVNLSAGTSYKILHAIASTYPAGMTLFDISSVQNLLIVDRSRAYRYDGTNVRVISGSGSEGYSMPAFGQVLVHKNYVFGVRHNSTDIRWSALKDATSWPSNNFQTVTTLADVMRGIVLFNDYIIIFTRSRMFRLLGDTFDPSNPTYVLERITTPPNFLFQYPRTAVLHDGILKFLAADGWYAYDGGDRIVKIGQQIQTDADGFVGLGSAEEDFTYPAVAYVWKNDLYCKITDSSGDHHVFVQDKRGKWWKWTYYASATPERIITDFVSAQFGASGSYSLVAGSFTDAGLITLDSGNRDGWVGGNSAISGYWVSKEFSFPSDVEFTHAIVTMKKQSAGNLTFSFSVDRRSFVDKTLDMTAGAGTVIRKMVNISRVGKGIRLKVANSTVNQTFEIYSIDLYFRQSQGFRV